MSRQSDVDRLLAAAISTEREIWYVKSEGPKDVGLVIVLDKVAAIPQSEAEKSHPLVHEIGEVEAGALIELSGDLEEDEKLKREMLATMDTMIEKFMKDGELFPIEPAPVGKLSAYFEWKKMVEKGETR